MSDKSFNLSIAFDIEPKKAVEFLRSKGLLLKKINEEELLRSIKAEAIRISRLTSLEMTKDIYASMEEAIKAGKSFNSWKKEVMANFAKKGWVDSSLSKRNPYIVDPKTGEMFGKPRRLSLIWRTNVGSAYSARRFQEHMDNVDFRPYWKYVAVRDSSTRPLHLRMHGSIYRYDDPFWSTFYPPNGFNCRCSVQALSKRDLEYDGLEVDSSEGKLIDIEKKGGMTKGFKTSDGKVITADKGFDHNIARTVYKPNLDDYPTNLANSFAKAEMTGADFKYVYTKAEQALNKLKSKLGTDKLTSTAILSVRQELGKEYKFASGVLSNETVKSLDSNTKTVWLSDDTLIKQINSRANDKYFNVDTYQVLPSVINQPDEILHSPKENHFEFIKVVGGKRYRVILKILDKEAFLQSFRLDKE